MKKNFKITSLTAAALASVVLANANFNNNVKAADAAQSEKTAAAKKEQSPEEQAKTNLDNAQKEVNDTQKSVDSSKADLEKAKAEAVKPDQAYQDQKIKTDKANDDAKNKKNVWDDAAKKQADAQKLADEATPEAINKAKQAVTDKNSEISKKQQDVKEAQAKQGAAQKGVDDAEADVSKKQAAVTDAQNAKKNADTQVANAQDALKGTGINEAAKKLKDANTSVKNDEQELIRAKNIFNQAKKAKADAETKLTSAENTRSKANEVLNETKKLNSEAQQKISKANTALADKKVEVDNLNQKLNKFKEASANTIEITNMDKYKQALMNYFKSGRLTQDDIDYMNEARSQNQYKSSSADKKEKVDLNNLTDEQKQDISLFVANITNKLRAQFGWKPESVVKGSLQFADDVSKQYNADNKNGSFFDWHDENALATNAKNMNVQRYGEAMYGDVLDSSITDMDNLKKSIYNGLLSLIYTNGNGVTEKGGTQYYELGHAALILGGELFYNDTESKPYFDSRDDIDIQDLKGKLKANEDYLAECEKIGLILSKESLENINNEIASLKKQIDEVKPDNISFSIDTLGGKTDGMVQYHFLLSKPYEENSRNYDEKVIPSYDEQINDLKTRLDKANQELITFKDNAEKANTEGKEAKVALEKINNEMTNAEKVLSKAENDKKLAVRAFEVAEKKVDSLEQKLSRDQNTKKYTSSIYNALTASNEEKAKNLENAQKTQTKAAQEVKTAKTALDTAKNNLASAKKAQSDLVTDIKNKQKSVEDTQNELVKLQARQSQLEGAHQALADAKTATQEAKKDYDTAKKVADEAKAQLDTLKPAKDAADAKVKDAQDEYDHAVSRLNDAKAKLDHAKQVLYDLEHPAIYLDDASEVQKPQTQKTVNTANNEVEKTTPTIKKSTSVKIEFIHNSYVYTLQGKIVKRHGKRYLIRKGHKAVALHNAKIVKINGKKFYQIAKNEYVKVVNTITATKKINVNAVVKGKKNHKVRTYSSMGKLSRHYVYGQRTYKFTAKKEIKGRTYYKVSGKNEWVPASKLTLK